MSILITRENAKITQQSRTGKHGRTKKKHSEQGEHHGLRTGKVRNTIEEEECRDRIRRWKPQEEKTNHTRLIGLLVTCVPCNRSMQSTVEDSTARCFLRRPDATPSYPEFLIYHGTTTTALCSYHDQRGLSNETGRSAEKPASDVVEAAVGSKGDNSSNLLLVAHARMSVLILLTLKKACFPSRA